MKTLIEHHTKIGTFSIAQSEDGRFHPFFDEEDLGSYASIMQAVDDLVNNATFSVLHPKTSELVDTSNLGIPEDPNDWERA